jgi:hypothetical protein
MTTHPFRVLQIQSRRGFRALADAEDLVPVYRRDGDGLWVASHTGYRRDADRWNPWN